MTGLTGEQRIRNLVMFLMLIFVFVLFSVVLASAASMPSSDIIGALSVNVDRPVRINVDGSGKLYVSDTNNNSVKVYANNGVPLLGISGLGKPVGVGVDSSGNIYIGEKVPGCVSVYNGAGEFLFKLGAGDGEFIMPSDIAVSLSGNVYITDSKRQLVGVYGSDGGHLFSFGSGQLSFPTGIAIDEGVQEVYVVNHNYKSIYIYDMNGNYQRQIRGSGGMMGGGNLHAAQGIAVDETRIFIADSYNSAIAVYGKNGIFLGYVGKYGENAGEMRIPLDVSFDNDGKLFVTNNNNGRVEVLGLDAYSVVTLDPSVVNITVYENSAPLTQVVNIFSNRAETWTARETCSWLSLGDPGGSAPGQMEFTVNPAGLGTGNYREFIAVTSSNGTEYAVEVNLDVVARPRELFVSPASVQVTLQKNSPDLPEADIVLTSQNGSVDWTGSPETSWLALDKYGGMTPDGIRAIIADEAKTFEEGFYTGRITIDAGAGVIGSPATVDVTLRVIVAGTLKVSTNHPDASFTISGPANYDGSGTEWINKETKPGNYTISFNHVSGFDRPAAQTFTVETGRETVVDATYTVRKSATHIVAASASSNGNKVSVLTLEGVEVISFVPFISAETLRVAAGDVNGDGADEIIVSDARNKVKICNFDGKEIGRLKLSPWLRQTGMTVGDVNNDGMDEVLLATVESRGRIPHRGSMVRAYMFNDGELSEEASLYETEKGGEIKIALGDMDGDGIVDLIVADGRRIEMVDIRTGDVTLLADTSEYLDIPEIALGDLNDDGVDDLIISGVDGKGTPRAVDDVSFISILGGGQIAGPFDDVTRGRPRSSFIAVADIDGDNKDELGVAGIGTRRGKSESLIRLYEGNLTFGGVTITPDTGGSDISIAFGVFE